VTKGGGALFSTFAAGRLFRDQVYETSPPAAIFFSVLLVFLYGFYRSSVWRVDQYLFAIILPTWVLHLTFSRFNPTHFGRYEAYLIALGIFALAISQELDKARINAWLRRRSWWKSIPVVLLALILAYPLVQRAIHYCGNTAAAMKNIHDQQYQMGLFLKRYFQGEVIAANDIGAITYLADIHLLDLAGLASKDVTLAIFHKNFKKDQMQRVAERHRASIAMIYETWFRDRIPDSWIRVAQWRISHNVICGESVVTFYAIDPEYRDRLREDLLDFSGALPADVRQRVLDVAD